MISPTVHTVRHLPRKLGLLARSLYRLLGDQNNFKRNMRRLRAGYHHGGLQDVKSILLQLPPAGLPPMAHWQTYRYRLEQEVLPALRERVQHPRAPQVLISVLVPTYNTPRAMLEQMLDSVLGQIYPHWELCIADDASSEPQVREVLQAYASKDARIKLDFSTHNQGVSHASNRALSLASGSFCVMLDHDDLLEPHALLRVAEAVVRDAPHMLYSDEVLVSHDGTEVEQYFHRPAFSPEYLRRHPYIVHLVGFRTALLREIGGWDESLRISQDYDLILRASERAETIVHLPEILYLWRKHLNSSGHDRIAQVMRASTEVVQRHLERTVRPGRVRTGMSFNFYEIDTPLRSGQRVAIVIPTKNHGELVRQCVNSLRATIREVDYELVLVDHASTDPASLAYFASLAQEQSTTVLRYEGVFNFSSINNWAVAQLRERGSSYTHYLFCNNDIEAIEPGWLEHMLALAQQEDVGMVGAQLLYPDGCTIQHAGVCVGLHGVAEHYGKFFELPPDRVCDGFLGRLIATHEVSAVTAACLLMRTDAFEAINGYDETLAVGFGDVDLCLRTLELGWRILYCPQATLLHHESKTRGKSVGFDPHPEDSAAFVARWREWLQRGDPYFSPAFSPNHTTWVVQDPLHCTLELRRRVYQRPVQAQRQVLRHSP